jgi:HEPN domain-containing protein
MATRRFKEVVRFERASAGRFEEAQFLLHEGGFTTAAVYLAGYAVECILKALILSNEPEARHGGTLSTFRGASAHALEWLCERLAERSVRLSPAASRDLAMVAGWTTSLRYDPRRIKRDEAEAILQAAARLIEWAKGEDVDGGCRHACHQKTPGGRQIRS